ncbi:MAG: nucleotidyltransferase domain-containing protein [Parasporobacterium sp.]|nr:nucleotidyltransferase domain-containing protein [Parasporobacterium sp.]
MIKPILKKYNAEQAVLFGSYARHEATPYSDIDLYVIGGNTFDPTDIFCIADELYKTAEKNVDVYEQREVKANSPLHHTILKEGVVII